MDFDTLESKWKPKYDECNLHRWEFSQMFGEDDSDGEHSDSESEEVCTDNWISSLAFDSTGKYLAVGYHCGQVVVLRQQKDHTYQLYTEFKSHDSEFDCLTSSEIEEKISVIKWFPFSQRGTQRLITSNDKTIKLFKLHERNSKESTNVQVRTERVFDGGHSYNINGIVFNSDGETFISSDDLRINLWNIEVKNEVFCIVDMKPDNMDDLVEIITASDFNPKNCNDLIYSSSRGIVRLGDMRDSALCDRYAKSFEDPIPTVTGYFEELVSSVSDVKFSPCGNYIAARDYLSIRIWDIRNERRPFNFIRFQDHLMNKLSDLYESDAMLDKFECHWNKNSSQIVTGSYNNTFYVCDVFGYGYQPIKALKPGQMGEIGAHEVLDVSQKVLKTAWHPQMNLLSMGAKDYGYLYQRRGGE